MSALMKVPVEFVEAVAEMRFPPKVDARLQELMDRNTEGLLTDSERRELESLAELSELMSWFRTQALHILGHDLVA
jgi:hypothetical protein